MSSGRNWREVKAEAHRLYPEMADPQRQAAADALLDAYVAGQAKQVLGKDTELERVVDLASDEDQ
jgi:hypothetical protein